MSILFFSWKKQSKASVLIISQISKTMKRPQSAKHVRNYWGQLSHDDTQPGDQSFKRFVNNHNKPLGNAVTSIDFSRHLPKRIQHDKERLYCQTLQLKTSLNELTEENYKLKTKISILEKQKERVHKRDDDGQKSRGGLLAKTSDKENGIVVNLKKMVRESKEENEQLKTQLNKIKRSLRFTKINQMQVERDTICDQNKRMAKMVQQLQTELSQRKRQVSHFQSLSNQLKIRTEELGELQGDNLRYQQLLEEMQVNNKQLSQKIMVLQKRLQRDVAVEKRRADNLNKQNLQLRSENKALIERLQGEKKRTDVLTKGSMMKKGIRPASSHPYSRGQVNKTYETETVKPNIVKQKEEAMQLNHKLQNELKEARKKLAASENQLKGQLKDNTLNVSGEPFELVLTKQDFGEKKETAEKVNANKKIQEVKDEKRGKTNKQGELNKKQLSKKAQIPIIKQIRQLLTYRMKYNRYTFDELKKDFEATPVSQLKCEDLRTMLCEQPFYLSKYYADEFLKVCYGCSRLSNDLQISAQVLIDNFRNIINDFELPIEEQEIKMLYSIADFMTKNRSHLEQQFKKLKPKGNFITKGQLITVLKQMGELSSQQIQQTVCYASVGCQSFSKINYQQLLDKFYINSKSLDKQPQLINEEDEEYLSLGENEQIDEGSELSDEDRMI